jgi:hypothetical protein
MVSFLRTPWNAITFLAKKGYANLWQATPFLEARDVCSEGFRKRPALVCLSFLWFSVSFCPTQAVQTGDHVRVDALLKRGGINLHGTNDLGQTGLIMAVLGRHHEVMRLLLNTPIDKDAMDQVCA